MPWVRLDDGFDEHPKIDGLSDAAFRAHVAGLCYASRTLTDGLIPTARASRLTATVRQRHLDELVAAGVWDKVADGYAVHDFLEYQPSKAKVVAEREATRQRVAKHRAGKSPAGGNGPGNGVTNAGGTDAPSRPDPSTELSSSVTSPFPVDNPEEEDRISRAIEAVAARRCDRANGVQNRTRWIAAAVRNLRTEEGAAERAEQLLADYPELTDGQLLDVLEGNVSVLRFLQRREGTA